MYRKRYAYSFSPPSHWNKSEVNLFSRDTNQTNRQILQKNPSAFQHTKKKDLALEKILFYHLCPGVQRVYIWFIRVPQSPILNLVLGNTFIDRFVQVVFPPEIKSVK